jgi:3-hydroxyisobutyrate dehydrogenase
VAKTAALEKVGAIVAANSAEVFARCQIVILMLVDSAAADEVLERGTPDFADRVKDRTIVQMGSTSPNYSKALEAELRCAGAHYVEAPVSGSRRPAEAGQLVVMLAGEEEAVTRIRPLLAPMCGETVACGSAPNALLMKLAVNIFLMAVVTGLAESMHFADRNGLDLTLLAKILNSGQLASDISRVKIAKLVGRDFAVQAAVPDALEANRLVAETARAAGIATPILDVCHALYGETLAMGLGACDMVAVLRAIEARSDRIPLAMT